MRHRIIYGGCSGTQIRYEIEGVEVTEAEYRQKTAPPVDNLAELFAARQCLAAQTPSCWPMESDAMAVHPDQIPEAMARNKRHGVHVEYNPKNGNAILKDRGQRRELMRIERFHDNHGGYGDDTGR